MNGDAARRRAGSGRGRWSLASACLPGRGKVAQTEFPGGGLVDLVLPAVAGIFDAIEFGAVWLDVQQRRAVEDVDIVQKERRSLYPDQLDDAQADGIGSAGGAGGKYPSRHILEKGLDQQLGRFRPVQMGDQVEVGKAGQILEPLAELRQDLGPALAAFGIGRLDGGLFGHGVRATDHADGEEGNAWLVHGSTCLAAYLPWE